MVRRRRSKRSRRSAAELDPLREFLEPYLVDDPELQELLPEILRMLHEIPDAA